MAPSRGGKFTGGRDAPGVPKQRRRKRRTSTPAGPDVLFANPVSSTAAGYQQWYGSCQALDGADVSALSSPNDPSARRPLRRSRRKRGSTWPSSGMTAMHWGTGALVAQARLLRARRNRS